MFPKFCGIKYLWTIFYHRTKAIFFGEDMYFWRMIPRILDIHILDDTTWMPQCGEIWNALIFVDNNVFVLQATQSKLPKFGGNTSSGSLFTTCQTSCFRRGRILTEHRLLKFDCVYTSEKLKGQLQSFYPKCLELGWEFINKIPLIILFI